MISRRKASIRNTFVALLSEVLVTAVGLLFPKAVIVNYGSEANGLVTSLQQFIQYFTLLEAGLSGAAVFALYKPLAEGNQEQIERILYSAKKMYSKIGGVFVAIVAAVSIVYPYFIAGTGYSNVVVSALFCLIGLNGATQLLFIGKYKVLLNASQNSRYVTMLNASTSCLYSIVIIVASYCKLPLLIAVSLGVTAYLVRAAAYHIVTKKLFSRYSFSYHGDVYRFQNQKEVFIQQILSLIVLNSSVLIMSFTKTDMTEISVFTVYNMVLTAVFMVTNAVNTGVSASFGDLIARNDKERLQGAYCEYELIFQIIWTVVFSCVLVLYQPFIALYTVGFEDGNYLRPSLCILFGVLGAIWTIRNQQSAIIVAAGKFKEIQRGSVIEAVLTVILSIIGLYAIGIEGLLIGRIISAVYRVIDFVRFSAKEVVKCGLRFTAIQILVSILVVALVCGICVVLQQIFVIETYISWIIFACLTALLALILSLAANCLVNRNQLKRVLYKLSRHKSKGM